MTTTMTIRLEQEIKQRPEQLAKASHRSKSYLTVDAIQTYLKTNEWQIKEIQAGIAEANAGDFANNDEIKAAFK